MIPDLITRWEERAEELNEESKEKPKDLRYRTLLIAATYQQCAAELREEYERSK